MLLTSKLHGLYAITDEKLMPAASFLQQAESALSSGVSILQYRDKSTDSDKRFQQARELKKLCLKYNALLIINDDIQLAKQVDAHGVHLGKGDETIQNARQQLGKTAIIGISCYNRLTLAEDAINNGADYIAFGSFFGSNIKPDAPEATLNLISDIKEKHSTPVCCIGGITSNNAQPLIEAGTDMIAVISDIFSQRSNNKIQQQCQQLTNIFTSQNNQIS